ncbi:MAG: hypothetical protein AABW99_02585, partial [archaeon]
MGISESIGGIYAGIEGKFYAAMDFLSDKGVPVYAVIDPLENRGIPAFPLAIAGFLIVAFLLYGFFILPSQQATIVLSITDDRGATLTGVSLSAIDSQDKAIELGSTTFRDGQRIPLKLGVGSRITVQASKDGYDSFTREVYFSGAEQAVELELKKQVKIIEGSLRLADSATGTPVSDAKIVASFSGGSIQCFESATENGFYTCPGVIEGDQTTLQITQANFEQKNFTTTMHSDSPDEVELVAKASASSGKSNLIARVYDFDSRQRLGNFTLKVYDAKDNELITEAAETDNDGEQAEKISKGTSVRVVVQRSDYLTYDSGLVGENITLRDAETIKDYYLKPGKNALTVGVIDVTGRPLPSISVNLYNNLGELIGTQDTGLAGEAIFESLSTETIYYVAAWQNKFIPAIETINLNVKNRTNLVLERATAQNSGSLTVYTVDEKNNAMNGVAINFSEQTDKNGAIPLGIPTQKSDATGKLSILVPLNKRILVTATKSGLEGEATVNVQDTFNNEAFITMRKPFSQVSLKVLDAAGKEVSGGKVTIVAGKNLLFEDSYTAGGVVFNPKENKYVTVTYEDADGKTFDEEVYVEGKDEVSISPTGKTGETTSPDIGFQGVFNIDGSQAQGISKGVDYFLKFKAVFAEGTTDNGFHVRLGEDSVNFADSQDAGITGFSAPGASSFYARSYSPQPSPGFEALDYSNSGSEGAYNKWLELYFKSGGEKIIKVRVKAKETSSSSETEVHYRAWSAIGSTIYRNPEDPELGKSVYSQNRTSLYAQTGVGKIRILESSATCANELCASYKFIRSDGSEFGPDNFKAALNGIYALEINLSPADARDITVKASTSKTKPKIAFQGYGIENFSDFPDTNSSDTSIQVDHVSVLPKESTSVRLYFKTKEKENSGITLQLISGETIINEQFYFEIFRERTMVLRTTPENVVFGEDFSIGLTGDDSLPVENAQIRIQNEAGDDLETIGGNGAVGKGTNGMYAIKNTFGSGTIRYEITAPEFRALDGTISITKTGMLSFADAQVSLIIRKGEKNVDKFIDLVNNSKQNLNSITFTAEPIGALPDGLAIEISPLSGLQAGQTQRISVSAKYTGENDSAHGAARIIARAKTESGFSVVAETRAVIDYNPKISSDCLEFSKDKLAVYVASGFEDRPYYDNRYGTLNSTEPTSYYKYNNFSASTTETFTAKLANRAECQLDLELTAQVVPRGQKTDGIEVDPEQIKVSPQLSETQGNRADIDEVTISITNKLLRNYPGKQKFSFDLVYKGSDFEKTVSLDVYIWNPRYALQMTNNIELFLGPNDRGQYAAQVPLFIRNIGEADIENVDIKVSSATSRGNVDIRIDPPFAIQFLKKGQAILPPKTILAQALRNEKTTLVDTKELDVTGVINGTTFNFGPIIVTSHISAEGCLIAVPGNVSYISTKSDEGAISQSISLRNTCAEPVRVREISQAPLGNNRLSISPADMVIAPGAEAKAELILEKKEDFQGPAVPVYIKAFLPNSGTTIESTPIIVDVKLGKYVKEGTAATERVTLNVCGGGTKDVRFPIIAAGNSPLCDSSYCDAQQLAAYLVDRIDSKITDAQKQIQSKSSEIQNAYCSQQELARGYCSFDGLGVKKETFSVYMGQDNLSTALLQKAIDKKTGIIRDFRADFISGDTGGEYLGGYSRQVFLNSNFRGCGRYTITLNGSVAVQGARLVPELMNMVVDITPDSIDGGSVREETEQCLARIQNISNFLPRDDGLTVSEKYDSWLGVVQARDEKLDGLAKDVAKTLFGSDQRATQSVSGSNTLKLDFGNEEGYIVRVEMDKVISENPVTISAYIKESIGSDDQLQKDIAKEAGQAIKDLRDNVVEGCISQDESYMLLKSTSSFELPVLKVTGPLNVLYNAPQCVDVNVTSKFTDSVSLSARKFSQFDGISADSPYFAAAPPQGAAPNPGAKITQLQIDKQDKKTNSYVGEAMVCVTGNAQLQQAQGKKIIVTAQRTSGEGKKPIETEVELNVCGVYPLDLLGKVKGKPNGEYYATVVWKGNPDKILLSDLPKLARAEEVAKTSNSIIDGKQSVTQGDPPELVQKKRKASY